MEQYVKKIMDDNMAAFMANSYVSEAKGSVFVFVRVAS